MKRFLPLAVLFLMAIVFGSGCQSPPPKMYTPDEIEAYKQTPQFKAAVRAQLDEIRALFARAIEQDLTFGHRTEAYVHFSRYHKGEAIAIVVEEVRAKGWIVEKTFTDSMMTVRPAKK